MNTGPEAVFQPVWGRAERYRLNHNDAHLRYFLTGMEWAHNICAHDNVYILFVSSGLLVAKPI
jgi:hypothetical protein